VAQAQKGLDTHGEEHGEAVIVATSTAWEECIWSTSGGKLWGTLRGVEEVPSALEGVWLVQSAVRVERRIHSIRPGTLCMYTDLL
jgi:hypothetical protein